MQCSNLDNFLIERGFLPLDKLITTYDNQPMVEYLLVNTSFGQYALVVMDVDNYQLSVNDQDRLLVPGDPSLISPGCKSTFFDQLSLDVAGIAFLRKDHICTLRRDAKTCRPLECSFYPSHHGDSSYPEMEIPIVLLRDILENSSNVMSIIYKTTNQLRHFQMRRLLNRYNEINPYLSEIYTYLPTIWSVKPQVDTLLSDGLQREETRNPAYPARLRIMNDRLIEYKHLLTRLNRALEMTDLPTSAREIKQISQELTDIRAVLMSEN